jgi:PPK2 family polyphosphate:nucleotide phosphotransferase
MTRPILVKPGSKLKLADIDADSTKGLDKESAAARLAKDRERITDAQEMLYAENKRAVLVVLQGMDTSGKDGTIKAVFTAVNPLGLEIASFGRPSDEELEHDFLWRIHNKTPRKGNIGIFNRSHYEDVLVVRVRKLVEEKVWKARYGQINRFEQLLNDMGITILKFFLHIDREEQKERLEERLADDKKHYKFRMGDLDDRALWREFQAAYEDALSKCSTEVAPWHIVPANKKWYRNALIAHTVADTLEAMKFRPTRVSFDPKTVKVPD